MKLYSHHNYCRQKAFTLVELVMAIGMALIVVSSTVAITILVQREVVGGFNQFDSVQNARVVVDRLTRDLRQTNNIVTNLADISEGIPGSDNIEFENGHDDSLGINYIKYYLSNNDLIKQTHHYSFASAPDTWVLWDAKDEFGQSPDLHIDTSYVVANNLSSFSFLENGPSLIVFAVTITTNGRSSQMKTQMMLRNLEY